MLKRRPSSHAGGGDELAVYVDAILEKGFAPAHDPE